MTKAAEKPDNNEPLPSYNTSAVIALLLLSPTIIIHFAGLISQRLLLPFGICHSFDGNGHGPNPLCWIANVAYIFGILASTGVFAIPILLGIALLLWLAARVRLYNRRNAHSPIKAHKAFIFASCSLILLSFSLSLCALVILPVYFIGVFARNRYFRADPRLRYSRTALVVFSLALLLHLPTFYAIYQFHQSTGYWSARRYYIEQLSRDQSVSDIDSTTPSTEGGSHATHQRQP